MNEENKEKYLSLAGVTIIIVGFVLIGLFFLGNADMYQHRLDKVIVSLFNPYNQDFFFPGVFLIIVGVVVVYFAKFHKK